MQEKTYLKVVLLGKVNSGKTCLVTRYITRSFSEETPSVSTVKLTLSLRAQSVDHLRNKREQTFKFNRT